MLAEYVPQEGDGVNVTVTHPCNPPGHEVPYRYPAVVTSHSKQCATTVEGASQCLATGV